MAGVLKVRARVRGERTVRRNLEGLAKDLDGRDMADSLLEGARVYARMMKSLAPRRSGQLSDSIYAFNAYRSDYSGTKGSRKVRLKLRPNEAMAVVSSRLGHIIEFGTKPHRIRPSKRKALVLADGTIVGSVERQAARAHPFWRPTLYQGANEAQRAVVNAVSVIVGKYD